MSYPVLFCSCVVVVFLWGGGGVGGGFSPFSIAITSLGEEKANLSAFCTFVRFALVWFVCFLFLLVSGKGSGLWLWHSMDFSLTLFGLWCRCFKCVFLSLWYVGRKVLGNYIYSLSLPSFPICGSSDCHWAPYFFNADLRLLCFTVTLMFHWWGRSFTQTKYLFLILSCIGIKGEGSSE